MSTIVGCINKKRSHDIGFVTPIYLLNEYGSIELVGDINRRKEKFPNSGTLIIIKDFDRIYDTYHDNEFFKLNFEETSSFDSSNSNSCKYQSLKGNTSSVEKLPLIHKATFDAYTEIIELPYSGHRYVFIEDGGFIYGPLSILQEEKYDRIDESIEKYQYKIISSLNTNNLDIDDDYQRVVFKYTRDQIEKYIVKNKFGRNDTTEEYIFNVKEVVSKVVPFQYILEEDDYDIIDWAEYALPKSFSKEMAESWVSPYDSNNPVNKIRFERFLAIKEKSTNWISFLDSYLSNNYFKSPEGREKLELFVKNNKEVLLGDFEQQLRKEVSEKHKELSSQITELEYIKLEKNDKIRDLEEEINKLVEQKDLLYSKSEELLKIESSIEKKIKELNTIKSFEEVRQQYESLQTTLNVLRNDIQSKQRDLDDLKKEYFKEAQDGSRKKVMELMPYVKALNFEFPSVHTEKPLIQKEVLSKFMNEEHLSIDAVVRDAKNFLHSNNRPLSEVDILNLLVTLNQNFLTIFVGLPGVGKTSLANLLSSFLTSPEFSLEIPVARGWNSRKSLLGFYNSLKGEYQVDEYGFVEKIRFCNQYKESIDKVSFIVTLDEANLSPIEHYWSDFITLCDKETERIIQINDPTKENEMILPEGLRFVFTVNNDHTTELLSPRLIDRASIIKLEYDAQKAELNFQASKLNDFRKFYSYSNWKTLFKPETFGLNQSEKRIFNDLINILNDKDVKLGRQVPVSPRKIKIISQYCSVIRKHLNEYQENQFLALDYAILQNVLPLISGHGKNFENRLNKFKDECLKRSLTKSYQEVDDIITRGKEFQNYSYFS